MRFFRGAPEAESVAAASKAVELAVHAELAPEPAPAPPARPDDLALLNGIGPKIAEMLGRAGITTFTELASTSVERLRELLAAGGRRFAAADPTRWPEQAARAAEGELPG